MDRSSQYNIYVKCYGNNYHYPIDVHSLINLNMFPQLISGLTCATQDSNVDIF